MTHKLSVVIPCHNGEPYLAQTLGSLLEQTRLPDEIVVVDDLSTDGSLQIAKRFAAHFPERIRVFAAQFGNAGATRNLGAVEACGSKLMFLDADDVIAPGTLAALESALQDVPGGVAFCPWYRLEFEDGRWVARRPSCRPRRTDEDALAGWLTGWYHPPCSVLWTREAYEATGRWDERGSVNDDGDLMMRALVDRVPTAFASGGAGFYRRLPEGGNSLSSKRLQRRSLELRLEDIEKIAYWINERSLLPLYQKPLGEAFQQIASDSLPEHPDIAERATANVRRYGPSFKDRFHARLFRKPKPFHPEPIHGVDAALIGHEISFGAATASTVCDNNGDVASVACSGKSDLSEDIVTVARQPLVSVIVPAFNRGDVISRTIRSVLDQTLTDFELLVIDDGSTDNTCEVVEQQTDTRIRLLRQPKNQGVCAARNRGLREARGRYLAFLDSDDEWFPEKLELQVRRFEELPDDVGLIYTGVESDFGNGQQSVELPAHRGDLYRDLLLTNVVHGGGSNVMVRRQVVASVGYFDATFPAIEDYDYWLRTSRFYRIDHVDRPLIRYHDQRELERPSERKSLNVDQNIRARIRFYNKHREEMLRAGVAHLFLLESANRRLRASRNELKPVRKLLIAAAWDRPQSSRPYRMLLELSPFGGLMERILWRFR